jgi:hypothetical protein
MASRNRIYDIEGDDDSSDESDIVPANPNASAAAYLARQSPGSKKDDNLTDSSLDDVHPDVAAGVFLSRLPKSDHERNLVERMKSATLSDSSGSICLEVDSSAAAAAFLARNKSATNENLDASSPVLNSDDDSDTDHMFSIDAHSAAAVFLSANSENDNGAFQSTSRNIIYNCIPEDNAIERIPESPITVGVPIITAAGSSANIFPL